MKKSLITLAIITLPALTYGAGCDEQFPSDGITVEDVAGGTKILATASTSSTFDDIDAVRDAKDEATLLAKAAISKFMSEGINSDEAIDKVVNETKSMTGEGKEAQRNEVKERLKALRNSSQALLRGVAVLADCYSKDSLEVRVSVGIKPEYINAAGNIAGGISKSVGSQPTPTSQSVRPSSDSPSSSATSTSKMPVQGVESHSNTDRLKNF